MNEHVVSTTGEVNVVRQHKYLITSTGTFFLKSPTPKLGFGDALNPAPYDTDPA